jgi:hypothetical protein
MAALGLQTTGHDHDFAMYRHAYGSFAAVGVMASATGNSPCPRAP